MKTVSSETIVTQNYHEISMSPDGLVPAILRMRALYIHRHSRD